MPKLHLPVRPDLEQLRHQAKDRLKEMRRADPAAKLSKAQLQLARDYGVSSWPRLVLACRLIDSIWRDDLDAVQEMVLANPKLLAENARGAQQCNWGPPMSYAANLGRDRVVTALRELGANDLDRAMGRAVLQGKIETARKLHSMGARLPRGAVMGPAETQNGAGMEYLLELGADICDADGDPLAPVALVLETYCRNPAGKHRCLELLAERGTVLPDTAPMAIHRGSLDLLKRRLQEEPGLLSRTFSHEEIYPAELGCHSDHSLALHGTPLDGGTLLHLCVDYGEFDLAEWLLEQGMDPNAKAAVDADGFGGHTALFGCVVTQLAHYGEGDRFARLLLEAGASPNSRANLRKRLRFVEDETTREYLDVTPVSWAKRFHDQGWVNRDALALVLEHGGRE
jgi:hypothetical protein